MPTTSDPSMPEPSGQLPTPPDAGAPTTTEDPPHVPVSALRAEREKRQALERQLAELTASQQAAAQKAAEQAGEYQRLYEEAKPRLERLTALEQAEAARSAKLAERNSERVTLLPNHLRDLIPEGIDGDALAAHLDRVERIAGTVNPGPAGGRAPLSSPAADDLTAEERAFASRFPADLAPAIIKKLYRKAHPAK